MTDEITGMDGAVLQKSSKWLLDSCNNKKKKIKGQPCSEQTTYIYIYFWFYANRNRSIKNIDHLYINNMVTCRRISDEEYLEQNTSIPDCSKN